MQNKNSYNDGVAMVVKEKQIMNDFNAKLNLKSLDDFEIIARLFYSEQSKRNEDMLFAQSMGKKLTLKIKTPMLNNVKNNYKVIIEKYVYDIIHIDFDKINRELYLYLEGVRALA